MAERLSGRFLCILSYVLPPSPVPGQQSAPPPEREAGRSFILCI
ncbi:hypothetical protein HMPREF0372_00208 [Flavonifractor plautii ATCC 29863]|uniref:Uncharacterized protein n=1 Tax=Flavonifractor plautii ATCC 29863 TaxID=411475 RepID=G9YL45_FLAPL|nr:hypothetical protein HMPREF0372_00208 [Flavonifractor plautii ATCC 29863]